MAKIIDNPNGRPASAGRARYREPNLGAGICLIFNDFDEVGRGPRLHAYPYPETFIMRAGNALFTVGDRQVRATAGQVLTIPANVPHRFENLGPGKLETIDIHESAEFVTEWLE